MDVARDGDPRRLQERFATWQSSTPVATRGLIFTLICLSLLCTLTFSRMSKVFDNTPYFVIAHFEIWRLVTASFFANNILSLIFQVWAVSYTSSKLERALGTMRFALTTLLLSVGISLMHVVFCVTVAYNYFHPYREAMLFGQRGIWGTIVAWSVLESKMDTRGTKQVFMFPWKIPTKYYPFALTALLCFFGFSWALPMGLGIGYLISHDTVSDETLQRLEDGSNSIASFLLISRSGYISRHEAAGGAAFVDEPVLDSGDRVDGSRGDGSTELESGGHTLGTGRGNVLGIVESAGEVPSAIDELLPRNDPGEAAAQAALRRMNQRQYRNT
jgi:membrane associated rhomboid family serine protease